MTIDNFTEKSSGDLKKQYRPRVRLTKKQKVQVKKETDRLFEEIGTQQLALLLDMKPTALNMMKARGYVGGEAVLKLCKIKAITDRGFTRESLRPDVIAWDEERV